MIKLALILMESNYTKLMDYNTIRERARPINTIVSCSAMVISTIAIFLGLILLFIITKKKWSKLYIDLKLVSMTVFVDLLVSIWAIVNSVLDLTNKIDYIGSQVGCTISGAISIIISTGTINCVAVTAIERYALIVLEASISDHLYYFILFGFVLTNILSCAITIVLKGFTPHPTSIYCMNDLQTSAGRIGLGFLGFSEMLSLVMVYFCYISIILARRRLALQAKEEFPMQFQNIDINWKSTVFKASLIIIGSTLSNVPYIIISTIWLARYELYTSVLDGIATLCLILNSIFNTFLILGMQPDLSKEFKSCLKNFFFK
ncbi:hypothetical protein CONCODRAFT_14197 [Conidiobolus coronatus NRRL 28638]|uniref:G-protein coupled receptors family 1 profile domain-containing protein n=1 Tax=Conidiobolus coronatus (strain ATCC 28846 / CBS 209.66 / NRRL 28638) TaxID=796925 RepID=A0A137NPG0_CONC2|nr:hypothetical protein CONCODRAFT_14197 [Conidiobolus coronatus NRRL 28638]|eukprot:KXN64630.1 hypothetical protein CONCODRAFT_14197 [Conidiobolus coronatus NRRL 28638]